MAVIEDFLLNNKFNTNGFSIYYQLDQSISFFRVLEW